MTALLPDQPDASISLGASAWIHRADLRYSFSRSSGPGGQAVNKLSTKAQLRVSISDIRNLDHAAAHRLRRLAGRRLTDNDEILIEAQTFRSQLDNKEESLRRLSDLVAVAQVRPKIRRKKKPTRSMIEKRLKAKRQSSEKKSRRRAKRLRNHDDT